MEPRELRRRQVDQVEQLSDRGDDRRTNLEYSCFPQNETSVAINPTNLNNLLTTQNDYRTLSRQGFGASVDGGKDWYDAELPPLSVPNADILDASGDPVSVFDRAGVAYSSSIDFNRTDDENGITVQRSTNGGFTWTRPCVPIGRWLRRPTRQVAVAARGIRGSRQTVSSRDFDDPDNLLCGAGPTCPPLTTRSGSRPVRGRGRTARLLHAARPRTAGCDPDVLGVDRLYVTWTRFDLLAGGSISATPTTRAARGRRRSSFTAARPSARSASATSSAT